MKGHWLSQTRKLNRHYQDGEWEEEEKKDPDKKTWDGKEPLDLHGALVAPFYGVFMNGKFVNYIDVRELSYQQSKNPEIEYAKLNVDVRPYIPRVADKYYDWNEEVIFGQHMEQGKQTELQWFAHEKGMEITVSDDRDYFFAKIGDLPSGTDLSKKMFTLVKPDYDLYILRAKYNKPKDIFDIHANSYDIEEIYNDFALKEVPIDIPKNEDIVKLTYDRTDGALRGFYGYFGEEPHGDLYMRDTSAYPSFFQKIKYKYRDKKYVITVGQLPETSPSTETSWAGKQYVREWTIGRVSQDCFPGRPDLPGNIYNFPSGFKLTFESIPQEKEHTYFVMFILKKISTIKGALTGW